MVLCVYLVHCGQMADWIRMPFGKVDWTGSGMRQVAGFVDQSMGMGYFGGKYGAPHCNQWGTFYYWEFPLRRGEAAAWQILRTTGASDGRGVQA